MHIPDGYLGPQTYVTMYGVMVPIWAVAARKVRKTLKARQVPLLALGAVFSFVIMMFNVPAPGGSTGHAVGGALIAIVLGAWAASLAITAALVVQALLFGDGGITAIGANCFNMAVVMPFAAYAVYKVIASGPAVSHKRRVAAAGLAGYVSINVAALIASIEFGIQPMIAHSATGVPLYAPYPLRIAIPAMMTEHLLVFGIIEAIVTGLVVGWLAKSEPSLLGLKSTGETSASISNQYPLRKLWWGLGALILLSPVGLIASGTAWGEWAADEIQKNLGFVPAGFAKLEGLWHSVFPDYAISGLTGKTGAIISYLFSAVLGVAVTGLLIFLISRMLIRRKEEMEGASTL
jgi:cobalt/nickel transport system permease protein